MQDKNRMKPKTLFWLITYGILLYMALQNFTAVKSVLAWFFAILRPVAYGVCIAFVINLFLNFFKKKVFKSMAASEKKWEQKLCPVLCVFCTTLVGLILLTMIVFLIIPQVTTAVNMLIEKMPTSQEQFLKLVEDKLTEWKAPKFLLEKLHEIDIDWNTVFSFVTNLMDGKVTTVLGTAFNATASVVSTATNLLLGLIIAIYLVAQKERVLYVLHKIIELFVPEKYRNSTFRILRLTNQSFANFLTGQVIEAFIIGTLCTVGLTVFRFPYAATIGVLTGITALLPIIGAWIGGGVGLLLVWVEAPDRAIWFLVFILALQQIEGQFIYPKVVGNSIGLPGLLVLVAVIVGGGFGGIMGIIFAVPLFAILYSLLKEAIDHLPSSNTESVPVEGSLPSESTQPDNAVTMESEPVVETETESVSVPVQPSAPASKRRRRRKHR